MMARRDKDSTIACLALRRVSVLFTNPWIGFAGTVFSFIGVALSLYLYRQSGTYPELRYLVLPFRSAIVANSELVKLEVWHGGSKLHKDVFMAQVRLENGGKQAISSQNILEPITIRTTGRVPILEARVMDSSRSVCDVTVDESNAASGEVTVKWKILEQNDGCMIQIAYEGGPDIGVLVGGVVQGQRSLVQMTYGHTDRHAGTSMDLAMVVLFFTALVFTYTDRFRLLPWKYMLRFLLFLAVLWLLWNTYVTLTSEFYWGG